MGYVIYVTDCETTGLDHTKHDIIEISMCRIFFAENREDEQRTWYLKPSKPENMDEKALQITGYKKADLCGLTKYGQETFLNPADVITQIELWVMGDDVSADDRILLGQNIGFDKDFMMDLWKRLGSENTFPFMVENNNRLIDTKQLAILIDLCTGNKRKFYNLSSLVKDFGVKKGKAHRAAEDVRMTRDLFLAQIGPIKDTIIKAFKP